MSHLRQCELALMMDVHGSSPFLHWEKFFRLLSTFCFKLPFADFIFTYSVYLFFESLINKQTVTNPLAFNLYQSEVKDLLIHLFLTQSFFHSSFIHLFVPKFPSFAELFICLFCYSFIHLCLNFYYLHIPRCPGLGHFQFFSTRL